MGLSIREDSCDNPSELITWHKIDWNNTGFILKFLLLCSALLLLVASGWRCGKSYELEFELLRDDDA